MKTRALLLATTILSVAVAFDSPRPAGAQGPATVQQGGGDQGKKDGGGKQGNDNKQGNRGKQDNNDNKQGNRGKQDNNDNRQGNRGKQDNNDNRQGNRGKQGNDQKQGNRDQGSPGGPQTRDSRQDNKDNDRKRAEERQREDRQRAEERQKREDRQRAEDRQKREDRQKAEDQDRRDRREREERQKAEDRQKRDDRQRAEDRDRRDDRKAADRDRWRRIEDVRKDRREERSGDRVVIREGNRTFVREGDKWIIQRDYSDRIRRLYPDARVERRGNDSYTTVIRPDGSRIVTVTDRDGRLIRRVRRDTRGREYVLIDNVYRGPRRDYRGFVVVLPPPVIRIPRDRYIVDAGLVGAPVIYETLMAPPVERIDRRYTLDEVLYSPTLRDRMPRVDLDTITFDSGSWEVTPDQVDRLAPIADGIKRAIEQNPNEVFLVEGHTDATGSDEDNLSLSDRRAESVALVLTEQFGIPPENLTTQGYGEQQLKVPTDGPERANRRVTVRRITPLLSGENQAPAQ